MDQKIESNLKKKIFIKTFGCQMNEYDSNRIFDITKKINYFPTKDNSEADCYIINTCHIREKATEKVFDLAAKTASMEQKKKLEHFLKMHVLDLWRVHSSKTSRFMMSLEKNTTPKNHLRRREKHHQMKNG